MAKLKDLLEENFSMVGGIVTQKPINSDSSLTGLVEDLYGEKPQKVSANEILEAVRTFNSIGKHLRSEANLRSIAKSLSEIASKAKTHTVQETEDWFDKVTVSRNMKDLTSLSKSFNKIAGEAHTLQERMGALYEDMGYILNRYYEMEGDDSENPQADQEDDMVKAGLKNVKGADINEGDYEAFFQKAMKKFGIKSPDELDDDKKKKFFNYVDNNYSAKDEGIIMIKLKDLVTERRLRDYDTSEMNDLLKRLNKLTADINKLWPQLQKTKAKTKWQKAQDIGYALQGLGRNMMYKLDRVRNILDAPEYDDDE